MSTEHRGMGKGATDMLRMIRHLIDEESVPLHRQLADPRVWSLRSSGNRDLFSLGTLLDVASAVSEYFSAPRSAQQWTDDVESGDLYKAADLLAQAKAALAIDPSEASWRLRHTRQTLKLTSTSNDGALD